MPVTKSRPDRSGSGHQRHHSPRRSPSPTPKAVAGRTRQQEQTRPTQARSGPDWARKAPAATLQHEGRRRAAALQPGPPAPSTTATARRAAVRCQQSPSRSAPRNSRRRTDAKAAPNRRRGLARPSTVDHRTAAIWARQLPTARAALGPPHPSKQRSAPRCRRTAPKQAPPRRRPSRRQHRQRRAAPARRRAAAPVAKRRIQARRPQPALRPLREETRDPRLRRQRLGFARPCPLATAREEGGEKEARRWRS